MTQPVTKAVESYLRIHGVDDPFGRIQRILSELLVIHGVSTETEAMRRLALFSGDITDEDRP